MKPPFRFIMVLVAAAGLLLVLSSTPLKAQNNTYYGVGALQTGSTTGLDDSAFGFDALYSTNTGGDNAAIGFGALQSNTAGGYNTASGSHSMYLNSAGGNNTATGDYSMYSNTMGSFNTANGDGAMYSNTTGSLDTANGSGSLYNNTSASFNAANGADSLFSTTTGSNDVANGYQALFDNTTGSYNTANGVNALFNNTTANYNTADGFQALFANKTGAQNVATGVDALYKNKTGSYNTADGVDALISVTTGNSNIALGHLAGYNLTTGSNNIDIGNQGVAAESNAIRIGTTNVQTSVSIAGIYTARITGVPVYTDTNGRLGIQATSSRRYKQDIKNMGDASDALLSLKPVTYQYKPEIDPASVPQFGLIAEDVEKACPNLIIRDNEGKPYAVRYDAVNVMLLNEFLKEHAKVGNLEASVARQQKEFERIGAQQEQEIKSLTASLKEQASLLQKVSAQMQVMRSTPQVVSNNN